MEPDGPWVGGDGGPLIVLQGGAVASWLGALDFMQSHMIGGHRETDYDAICGLAGHHLHRHGRDMLVLDDCEWQARMGLRDGSTVVIEQPYGSPMSPAAMARFLATREPTETFPFRVEDDRIRLMVGADPGDDPSYGFRDVAIEPGPKTCRIYQTKNVLVVTITPA